MSDYYVVEEYSDEDIRYPSSAGVIPIGRVVKIKDPLKGEFRADGWVERVDIIPVYLHEGEIGFLHYYFKVKLRPVDALEAFAIEAGLFNPKQGENRETNV